jgi:hypothetical protein
MKLLSSDYPSPLPVSQYRIDLERGMRIEEYHGKVRLEDLRSVVTAMASDPCGSEGRHGLVDFTDAELELSANDVLRMALTLRREENRTRGWMVFAVKDPAVYGVVRMLGYWSRNTDRFRIFQSRQEAEAWLDRHLDDAPPAFDEIQPAPQLDRVALRSVG